MKSKCGKKINQSKKQFRRSSLAVFVMAASTGTMAQKSESEIDEEVIVKGIRANIANAAEMKRSADTHVDVISAKDINALPDLSVLEAIQRIPGISIERFAAGNDPDHYSVEGSGLILRGLPQTRSEFNGRDAFSANNGEGLSFQDVSPELMGAVEVIKNHTADMAAGGISGTVNLITRKPFDSDEPQAVASVSANYNDHRHSSPASYNNLTPSTSFLLSNTWDTELGGRMGMLLSYANSEQNYRTDGFEAGLWEPFDVEIAGETTQRYAPNAVGVRTTERDVKREAGSFVWQFENAPETFDATFEYFLSDAETDWNESALFHDEARLAPSSDAVYDDTALISGLLVATSANVEDGHRAQQRRSLSESKVEDFSLKLNWKPIDPLTLTFDLQYVDANTDAVDLSLFGGVTTDAYVDFSGDIPDITILAPGLDADDVEGNRAYFTSDETYTHLAAMDHLEESEGEETAFEFDALYEFDDGIIDSVQSGVRYAEREQITRWSAFNWGVLSAAWNGDGRRVYFDGTLDDDPWDGTVAGEEVWGDIPTPDFVEPSNFFRGNSDSGVAGGAWLSPSSSILNSYDAYTSFVDEFEFAAGHAGEREGATVDGIYLPDEVNPVDETFEEAYIRINFSNGDDRLVGNLGFRYVSQEVSTSGGILFPQPFGEEIENIILAGVDLTEFGYTDEEVAALNLATADDVAFANGGSDPQSAQSDFSTVLPSFNLRFELTDDMYVRFAVSQSVAFPETGLYRYSYPVGFADVQPIQADPGVTGSPIIAVALGDSEGAGEEGITTEVQTNGNPFLEPMESVNVDLSWEWYFGEGNSLAVGAFYKDIENFFATANTLQDFTNNGVTRTTNVYSAVNTGDGRLSGVELAYSQFWDSGLGVQFNYTFLQEDNVPTQNTRSVDAGDGTRTVPPFEDLPLEGLSEHTFNLVGIYEKDGLRARLAYNYRSEYLLTQRQVNLGVPIFSDAVGILDGSIAYDVTDNLEVDFSVKNILDNVTETTAQINQEGLRLPRNYFMNDRRYALKVTFRL